MTETQQPQEESNVLRRTTVGSGTKESQQDRSVLDDAPAAHEEIPTRKWPTWNFTVPASARISPNDPTKVTLRELDVDLLSEARRLGRGEDGRSTDEAVKLSLWKVDGRLVRHGEDEHTYYWHRFSAKVRNVLSVGWAKIHATDDEEDAAFLASMEPGD